MPQQSKPCWESVTAGCPPPRSSCQSHPSSSTQPIWLFWSVQVVAFFFFSSGISPQIAPSCKLNKLIPSAETLQQRSRKRELTWEMLHCPPAQPLQPIEFNQLQLNRNKTAQPCCNAIAELAKKNPIYLAACSEKAQPAPRHSASHLFTRSTLQISNSIQLFFLTVHLPLKLRSAFLSLLKSILVFPFQGNCFSFKTVEISSQLLQLSLHPRIGDYKIQLAALGLYKSPARNLYLMGCNPPPSLKLAGTRGSSLRESPPKPPLLPQQGLSNNCPV